MRNLRVDERAWHDARLRARTAPYLLRRTKKSVSPELPPKLDGASRETWSSFKVKRGQKLSFDFLKKGARAYIAVAGGIDVLGRIGTPSYETDWPTIAESDPEIVLVMPCGYHTDEVERELQTLPLPRAWHELRAVRSGSVFVTDASSHFSRPGPRIVDGIEVMAQIFRRYSRSANKKSTRKAQFINSFIAS